MFEQDPGEFATRVGRLLRTPETLDHTFEARLMAAVRATDPPPSGAAGHVARAAGIPFRSLSARWPGAGWRWMIQPRSVQVSPLAGMAFAVGCAILVAGAAVGIARSSPSASGYAANVSAPAAAARDTVTIVQFVIAAPAASHVSLVGDFNDWDGTATPLQRTVAAGVWTVSVPLISGRHEYAFLVNGTTWMPDPAAPAAVEDDFGLPNSVVTVAERAI